MLKLVIAELIISVLGTLLFMILFGNPTKARNRRMAWHVMAFAAAYGVKDLFLLLIAWQVQVPVWVFGVVLGCVDAVVIWRLVLLLRHPSKSMEVYGGPVDSE